MSGYRRAVAVVFIFAVTHSACDRPSPATAPPLAGLSVGETNSGAGQSASGSGHFGGFGPRPFGWRVFAFNASDGPDGTLQGRFEIEATRNFALQGDVVCISVVDNVAWVGGILRHINAPDLEFVIGWAGFFRVVDNGEGGRSPVDHVTFVDIDPDPSAATAYCRDRPVWQPLNSIEAGNIQVRSY